MSHNAADGQPISLVCLKLAEDVYEQTAGRIQIELYPNNTLGAETVTRDMLTEGTLEMLALLCRYYGKKYDFPRGEKFNFKRFMKSFKDAIWAISAPVIILGDRNVYCNSICNFCRVIYL